MGETYQEEQERYQAEVVAAEASIEVRVIGADGLTIPRAVWDEAWLVYVERYHPRANARLRILREGFWMRELDDFYPAWRPVTQKIRELEAEIQRLRGELAMHALMEPAPKGTVDCLP